MWANVLFAPPVFIIPNLLINDCNRCDVDYPSRRFQMVLEKLFKLIKMNGSLLLHFTVMRLKT